MGVSGWRRLVHLTDFADSVLAEKQYPDVKGEASKLMKALKEQGLEDKSLNEETQKRYLSLEKRVQRHKALLARWEMYHQRDSLVDGITIGVSYSPVTSRMISLMSCSSCSSSSEQI